MIVLEAKNNVFQTNQINILKNRLHLKERQKIIGIVTEKAFPMVTVDISGIIIQLKTQKELIEHIGDIIEFKVNKNEKGKLGLEYIEKKYEEDNTTVQQNKYYDLLKEKLINANVKITADYLSVAEFMQKRQIDINEENFDKIKELKKDIHTTVNGLTENTLKNAGKYGYSADKITVDILSKIIKKADDIQKVKISSKETKQQIKKHIKQYKDMFKDKNKLEKAVKVLTKQGAAVTENNLKQMIEFQDIFDKIKSIDEKTIAQIIRNGSSLTVQNIYKAIYSGGITSNADIWGKSNNPYEDAGLSNYSKKQNNINVSEEQTKKFIQQLGLNTDEQTIKVANILIKNDLPINRENIKKVMQLNKTNKADDSKIDKILEKAVCQLKKGKNVLDVLITYTDDSSENIKSKLPMTEQEIKSLISEIPKIKEQNIEILLKKGIGLTLKNLIQIQNATLANLDTKIETKLDNNKQIITAKRQLEEIRLKLTTEAANKLNSKNIKIDTMPLKELVNKLKGLEKETYSKHLELAGAEPSQVNIEKMSKIQDTINEIKTIPATTLGKVYTLDIPFNIEQIHKAQNAVQTYELLGTQPEQQFGDTYQKIADQIEPLITKLDIKPTDENIRATRILIQNNIPITNESIEHIKLLDQKVNNVIEHLHPAVAANMIKDNMNPLKMHVDEVIEYINHFKQYFGKNTKEQIAKYIMQMDKQQNISPAERQGMTAIYRMFHTIQNSKGRAVGFLMKNNMTLTLDNLMESAKYLIRTGGKLTDIDVNIDDTFGAIDKLKIDEKNIREQLKTALQKANMAAVKSNTMRAEILENENLSLTSNKLIQHANMQNLLNRVMSEMSPKTISMLNETHPKFTQMPIEELLNNLKKMGNEIEDDGEINKTLQEVKQLENIKTPVLRFISKYNIKPTFRNIQIIKDMMENQFYLGDTLEDIDKLLEKNKKEQHRFAENMGNKLQQIKEGKSPKKILDEVKEHIQKIQREAIDIKHNDKEIIFKHTDTIEKMIDIQKQVQQTEEIYQIPIMQQDKMTNLNLYILNDKEAQANWEEGKIKAVISLKTNNLGIIQSYIKIDNNNVDFTIQCQNKVDTNFLREYKQQLTKIIERIGYTLKAVEYTHTEPENIMVKSVEDQAELPKIKKYRDSKIEITV